MVLARGAERATPRLFVRVATPDRHDMALSVRDVTVPVVYADNHYVAREGVRRLLEAPGLELVDVCAELRR